MMQRFRPLSFSLVGNLKTETWDSAMVRFWRTGQFINIIPFQYDTSSSCLKPSRIFPYRALWWLVYLLHSFDLIYLLYSSQYVTLTTVSETEFINFYVHFISRCIGSLCLLPTILCSDTFSTFCNFLLRISHKYRFNSSSEKRLDQFSSFVVTFCLYQPIFPLLLHLHSRHSMRYWPSQYLSRDIYDSFGFALVYTINDLIYSFLGIYGSILLGGPIFLYPPFARQWILSLRAQIGQNNISFEDAVRRYREQRLFNVMFNRTFSKFCMPLLIGSTVVLVGLLMGSVLSSVHRLPIPVIFNCILASLLTLVGIRRVLKDGGKIKATSKEVKGVLMLTTNGKGNGFGFRRKGRILKSCIDIELIVLSAHTKTESFAEYLDTVINQTVGYLMLIKKW